MLSESSSSSSLGSHKSWSASIKKEKREEKKKRKMEKLKKVPAIPNQPRLSQPGLPISIMEPGAPVRASESNQIIGEEKKENMSGSIASAGPASSQKSDRERASDPQAAVVQDDPDNQAQCRLCWDSEFDEVNPLLQICKCRGGVEFIHFNCVKSWLKTKEYRQ